MAEVTRVIESDPVQKEEKKKVVVVFRARLAACGSCALHV